MTNLTETELFDRMRQSLGEADRACEALGRNADPDHIALRGKHYIALKTALEHMETSARQIATMREDGRWLRLGAVYGRTRIRLQPIFMKGRWSLFTELRKMFEGGRRAIDDLDVRTGVIGPILPQRASEWLWMPPANPVVPGRPKLVH